MFFSKMSSEVSLCLEEKFPEIVQEFWHINNVYSRMAGGYIKYVCDEVGG